MSSIEKLALVKPSENAGSRSANRFMYQINWGLKKLIDLEYNDEDYIMILDYHDDIVICNSDKQSDYIDFYQIKTKITGDWTLSELRKSAISLSDEEDYTNNKSILAKLLYHTIRFEECRKLYFVTTSKLSKSLYGKSDDIVEFISLKPEIQNKIKCNVQKEIPSICDEAFDKLVFIQNQMNVNSYQQTMIGTLTQFLKEKFQTITDVEIVYDNIISMLKNKNDFESQIFNKQDLIKKKAISHEEFRNYLNGLTFLKSYEEIENKIMNDLAPVLRFDEKHSVRKYFKEIYKDLMDYENDELQNLIAIIRNTININVPDETDKNLWEYGDKILNIISPHFNNYKGHPNLYIKTLILYLYGKEN